MLLTFPPLQKAQWKEALRHLTQKPTTGQLTALLDASLLGRWPNFMPQELQEH